MAGQIAETIVMSLPPAGKTVTRILSSLVTMGTVLTSALSAMGTLTAGMGVMNIIVQFVLLINSNVVTTPVLTGGGSVMANLIAKTRVMRARGPAAAWLHTFSAVMMDIALSLSMCVTDIGTVAMGQMRDCAPASVTQQAALSQILHMAAVSVRNLQLDLNVTNARRMLSTSVRGTNMVAYLASAWASPRLVPPQIVTGNRNILTSPMTGKGLRLLMGIYKTLSEMTCLWTLTAKN